MKENIATLATSLHEKENKNTEQLKGESTSTEYKGEGTEAKGTHRIKLTEEAYRFLDADDNKTASPAPAASTKAAASAQTQTITTVTAAMAATDTPLTDTAQLQEKVIEALKEIFDPEIPVNIYDLGLIYGIEIDSTCNVTIKMTLTSPMCPVAQTFPQTVQDRILQVAGITGVTVELVWEPTWTKEMMSEVAKLQLNLF